MTPQEASEELKEEFEIFKNSIDPAEWENPNEELKKIIEANTMAIKALEKDIAKEPAQTHKRYGHGDEYDDYYCPECDKFLAYEPQGNRYKQEGGCSRCEKCGQKIKWESDSE